MINFKDKKTVSLIAVTISLVVLIGFSLVMFFYSPTIKMEDFSNKTVQDVTAWITESKIPEEQVQLEYIYSEEVEKDNVISQSVSKDEKLNAKDIVVITISLGPDLDVVVDFPENMKKMTEEQLTKFFEDNYFADYTFEYVTSDEVDETYFVSINIEDNQAKRSDMIIIQISVGTQSVGIEIPMADLTKMTKSDITKWAAVNNITVTYEEDYSDKIAKGTVISQSVESGTTIKTGDSITVVISKGAKITITSMVGKTKTEVTNWANNNKLKVKFIDNYSTTQDKGKTISTKPSSGTLSEGETLTVYISLGAYDPDIKTFENITSTKAKGLVDDAIKLGAADWKYVVGKEVEDDKKTPGNTIGCVKDTTKKTITCNVVKEKTVSMPNMPGYTESELKSKISELGLKVGTGTHRWNENVGAGKIVENTNGTLKVSTVINYIVSDGAYNPPHETFSSLDECNSAIAAAKNSGAPSTWTCKVEYKTSETISSGKRISSSINGKTITIVISKGKELKVPNFEGEAVGKLIEFASSNGLTLTDTPNKAYSDTIEKGKIISNTTGAVEPGSVIMYTISKGSQTFKLKLPLTIYQVENDLNASKQNILNHLKDEYDYTNVSFNEIVNDENAGKILNPAKYMKDQIIDRESTLVVDISKGPQ